MGYIDLILIIIIVIIGLRGFYNGFINEIAGVLGITLGVFFASRFAPIMGDWFTANIHNFNSPSAASLIGFVIILAVIWVAFLILGVFIAKFVKISDFIIVDKTLGFIFSCCKIFLIIGFILYGISKPKFMKSFNEHMTQNSKIYNIMNTISSSIIQLQSVQETADNLKNMSQPAVDSATQKLQDAVNNGSEELGNSIKDSAQDALKKIPSQIKESTNQE